MVVFRGGWGFGARSPTAAAAEPAAAGAAGGLVGRAAVSKSWLEGRLERVPLMLFCMKPALAFDGLRLGGWQKASLWFSVLREKIPQALAGRDLACQRPHDFAGDLVSQLRPGEALGIGIVLQTLLPQPGLRACGEFVAHNLDQRFASLFTPLGVQSLTDR